MSSASEGLTDTRFKSQDDIIQLTAAEIHELQKQELIQIIRLGQIPFLDESRLDYQDMDTLRRLAFLARNCCQNQAV